MSAADWVAVVVSLVAVVGATVLVWRNRDTPFDPKDGADPETGWPFGGGEDEDKDS